jgi:Rrf2 family protein
MLRLSKKTDYALMAMMHLAAHADRGAASARDIAEQYDIPLELLAKVLQQLMRKGFLKSQHGTRGGYHLARPAATVSVADIVEAIDGPLSITHCGVSEDCDQFSKCNVRHPLWQIRERIISALAGCTLAEMATGGFMAAGCEDQRYPLVVRTQA